MIGGGHVGPRLDYGEEGRRMSKREVRRDWDQADRPSSGKEVPLDEMDIRRMSLIQEVQVRNEGRRRSRIRDENVNNRGFGGGWNALGNRASTAADREYVGGWREERDTDLHGGDHGPQGGLGKVGGRDQSEGQGGELNELTAVNPVAVEWRRRSGLEETPRSPSSTAGQTAPRSGRPSTSSQRRG